ncbi:MAG TPA: glycoside hydrolase family 15 protein [Sphingobacteriaceae bacterium]|nr:glycoside hydrolase family 15 protein [Sphingobacteriaceae bacterium]
MMQNKLPRHTYDHGIIGNCAYIAHIANDTSVCWLCWPDFDSSFVFGSLLDRSKGGDFSILPLGEFKTTQYYIENTNVLCTEITTSDGKYRVTDFAPRYKKEGDYYRPRSLYRIIEPLHGTPKIKITCQPRGKYGRETFRSMASEHFIDYRLKSERLVLESNIPMASVVDSAEITLDKKIVLALHYGEKPVEPGFEKAEQCLRSTIAYWRSWTKHATISPFAQELVIRSALALKIHQFEDTGAIIAASTTSLPEYPGSGRNWDYRFCWLRDSYYVVTALNHIGQFEEMEMYAQYIHRISQLNPQRLQPLYSIHGEAKLKESQLDHLEGYQGNKPVRIGNQAYEHIQNDVHGQAMIALLPLYTDHRYVFRERTDTGLWVNFILDKIEATIHEKDAGIWEFRDIANRHCYSNLFQWAGCAAAIKIGHTIGKPAIVQRAKKLMKIAADYIEDCYDPDKKAYHHAAEGNSMDASTLQLIMMNYLDPNSQKAKDHLSALEKTLKTPEGLFYRYKYPDDFGKPKSTFLICAFWYVEALACVGRLDEAIETFHRLSTYSNELMLFSEDVTESDGSQWGNFPQAYSHVGLVNAAYRISMKLDKPLFLY